ncbi:MAG: sulfotransferase family protein [Longimicrobiales bacterium]
MLNPIHRRLFIGGCSRSGTTFLQRLLAGHSRIHTFPETGVFLKALGMRGRVLPWTWLGLTLGKERKALARLRDHADLDPAHGPPLPPRRVLLQSSADDIVCFLDGLTRRMGKDVWVEKTPRHVLHAARIRRLVPKSLFIHVVRAGPDVVASIVDRARKFPDRFPRQGDPAYGMRQWNRSMRATEIAMGEPGHIVVGYELLASRPEETLRGLCRRIGIGFEGGMLEAAADGSFILEEEGWKAPLSGPIRPAPSKFPALFDEGTRRRINEGLDQRFHEVVEERLRNARDKVWSSDDSPR